MKQIPRSQLYHPYVVGNRIYLRGFEKKDLTGNYFNWANDPAVTHYLFMGAKPNIAENMEEWFNTMRHDASETLFVICDKQNNKVIGFCGLHRIDWIGRTAEYRIFLGEKDYWGKGIGQEAGKLLVRYGFEKLNMNKVWLGVTDENVPAVKSYEKLGFVHEGVLRQDNYRNSKYYNTVRMSILRDEYYGPLKASWDKELPNPSEIGQVRKR
jgi:RimJ/RimL family protein N-acetyltransferase